MIYTVTFNPALDYVIGVEDIRLGEINRMKEEAISYGGKGINVSVVLQELGMESKALGFVAGFTGDEIERSVQAQGVSTDFIHLEEGMSRINIKIKSEEETEINGQGPVITKEALKELVKKLDTLKSQDSLVLAGSIPNTLPDDVYEQIMEQVKQKHVQVVVDATGELLKKVLKYRPFLIKPNSIELGELFGVTLETDQEIEQYARKLQQLGARNVLVSRASKGAILLSEEGEVYKMGVPKGTVVNSVGAGDSMVAGFLAGYLQWNEYEKALQLGTAAGSATAFSKGLAKRSKIDALFAAL